MLFRSKFIDDHPYSYTAWYNLGCVQSKLELYEKALDAFDFAIVINEEFTTAYFNKANALYNLERYNEAISVYKETFSLEKPEALTFYYIGECYERLEDYRKAKINYNKAIQLNPDLADAWMGIGIVLDNQNLRTEGIHRSEERRVGKSVDLGGRRIMKKKKEKGKIDKS